MALQLRLQGSPSNGRFARQFLKQAGNEWPFQGDSPIAVSFVPSLTTSRGRLLSGENVGTPVHAATFLRGRRIVLETQLLAQRKSLRFILAHELFHFVWWRLGNAARAQFTALIAAEAAAHARGETGESSEVAKSRWQQQPDSLYLWKHYVCERFCDTGASLICQEARSLPDRWRVYRHSWFESTIPDGGWRC